MATRNVYFDQPCPLFYLLPVAIVELHPPSFSQLKGKAFDLQ